MSNKFSILNFFFSKLFFKHLFLSLCAVIFFLLFVLFYLKIYTNHNNNIVLPSFIGENISDVDSLINSLSLRYLIIDSIYDRNKLPGEIITQDPLPGISVKENRRIYLSIIAENQQKITMPNLIDLTILNIFNTNPKRQRLVILNLYQVYLLRPEPISFGRSVVTE